MDLALAAPITQRTASSRVDLPQPFGPTMPVSPGSTGARMGSTKDLKPARRSSVMCKGAPGPFVYWLAAMAASSMRDMPS